MGIISDFLAKKQEQEVGRDNNSPEHMAYVRSHKKGGSFKKVYMTRKWLLEPLSQEELEILDSVLKVRKGANLRTVADKVGLSNVNQAYLYLHKLSLRFIFQYINS